MDDESDQEATKNQTEPPYVDPTLSEEDGYTDQPENVTQCTTMAPEREKEGQQRYTMRLRNHSRTKADCQMDAEVESQASDDSVTDQHHFSKEVNKPKTRAKHREVHHIKEKVLTDTSESEDKGEKQQDHPTLTESLRCRTQANIKTRISPDKNSSIWLTLHPYTIFLLAAAGVLVSYLVLKGGGDSCAQIRLKDTDKFSREIGRLRSVFTQQSENFWQGILALGRNHIQLVKNGQVKKPLVIMMAGFERNKKTVRCLTLNIAKAFSEAKPFDIATDQINSSSSRDLKFLLDKTLEEFLCSEPSKTVAVHLLQYISYETACIFYKYCDNGHTVVPEAVFIFSVTLPDEGYEGASNQRKVTREFERFLRNEVWTNVPHEQSMALAIRVAEVVLYVENEEENEKLLKHCA